MLKAALQKVVDVRDDEIRALLWATAYGVLILFSYYILRAVRDEISSADRGNLQLLWTGTFLAMMVAVPLYSWVASRFQRGVFVPLANRFFIANLVLFYLAIELLPLDARPWIDRAFYVWAAVFALFVVTVFWGFMADGFRNEQGKRLFAFIAVGSSLGGILGSAVTAGLADAVPRFTLLLIACVPLEAASWCAAVLHRRFSAEDREGAAARDERGGGKRGEGSRPLGGTAWSGIGVVFRSPYLLGIASFIALMTFASTILYFQQANLIGEAITDRGVRTAFYAKIDLAVSVLTIVFQVYLTAKIIRWIGVGVSLALVPAAVFAGFVAMGLWPTLAALVVVQVAYRAGRYGITKPAREVLWTVVGREEKYKSKAFLDAAVYRGGDLVSGWTYAGLAALGLSIGAIALVAAPLAIVWTVVGLKLGRQQEERAAGESGGGSPEASRELAPA
ncbi:MAG: NTP/NDP exchange transporter [Gemmatimonadota bacterium]